jgi:hypothetical protein
MVLYAHVVHVHPLEVCPVYLPTSHLCFERIRLKLRPKVVHPIEIFAESKHDLPGTVLLVLLLVDKEEVLLLKLQKFRAPLPLEDLHVVIVSLKSA